MGGECAHLTATNEGRRIQNQKRQKTKNLLLHHHEPRSLELEIGQRIFIVQTTSRRQRPAAAPDSHTARPKLHDATEPVERGTPNDREKKDKFVLVTSPIQHDESPSTSKIHRESRQYAIPQYHSQHPEVALSVSRRRVRPLNLDPNRRQAISGGARMRTLDSPSLNSARLNSRRHIPLSEDC